MPITNVGISLIHGMPWDRCPGIALLGDVAQAYALFFEFINFAFNFGAILDKL